jgi:putative membrane protein
LTGQGIGGRGAVAPFVTERTMNRLLFATAVVAVCAGPAFAQNQPATGASPAQPGAMQTQAMPGDQFAKTVATSDMFEIESSKLAEQKARDAKIKSYARLMVKDHSKTSAQLKQTLAKAKMNVELPAQLDAKHAQKLKDLQGASGDGFDQMYQQAQVEAHQEAVNLFQTYAANGDNKDLKRFASKTLPHLKAHLSKAESWKPAARTGQAR